MTGKRKSAVGRAGRSEADLGQKEAQLEKTQAELETASEAQQSGQGRSEGENSVQIVRTPSAREIYPGVFLVAPVRAKAQCTAPCF